MIYRIASFTWPPLLVKCLVASLLLFLAGCRSNSNELRVERKNFDQEIAQEQNLVFTFDKALVAGKLSQKWDTTQYIKFIPEVKGRFKWTAPNELVFSPSRPFAPSTAFQADLTEYLLTHSEKKYTIPADHTIRFHTPYLDLAEAKAYWAQAEEHGQLEARVNLKFNYQVSPGELANKLHLYSGSAEIPLEIIAGNQQDGIGIRLKSDQHLKEEATLVRLKIDPGLGTPGTSYLTKKQIEYDVTVPTRQSLQISEVTTTTDNNQEQIFVATTLPVSEENLQKFVSLQPKVDFLVEVQEGGFVLRGNIPQENTYTLEVSKYLKAIGGIMLGQDYSHPVSFQSLRPGISFESSKSIYLSSTGSRNIALSVVQVPRIKVSIGRIFENNILRYLQDGKQYDGHWDEQTEEYFENAYFPVNETNGKIIFEREYETKNLRKQDNAYLLNLNLDDLDFDSEFKGLYVLHVTSTEKNWLSDSKVISVSDIGLIAKQGRDEVVVFANSIREATAAAGVEIKFISTNNQVVHKATTDRDGIARFSDIATNAPDFKIGLITARSGQDFTYLPYQQTQVNTSRFEVGGKRLNAVNYDAYIYGDRDLYRPGDVIHVNTLVRTPSWETVAGLPLKVKLLLPNGKEFKSVRGKLNAQGAFEITFTLPTEGVTGTYTLEVYSGNDVLLNAKKIGVEEFMPDRLKVTATPNKTVYNAGEKVEATLLAQNFFGPPAADRNYEVQLSLKKKLFEAKQFPDYNFNVQTSGSVDIQNSVRQGETDDKGQGKETFELSDYKDIGVLDGSLFTTVFDETGRPVNRLSKFIVNTQQVFYGIRRFDAYVSTRQAMRVPIVALAANGKPFATAPAQVQVVRYTYESVIERRYGDYNYKSQRKENILQTKTIQVPASGSFYSFTPTQSGSYEIRVMRPGALNYVAQEFYAYGYGDTETTSFEVNNEGEVDITLDKESYEVGEEAKVLFKSPFAGKILVTVEQDKVMSHFYLATDKKAASITLPIKAEHLPTLYITATALRPVKDSSLPLTIARGFVPVKVTKKSTQLDVAITAPEVSRSKRVQRIKVKTAPHAEVTVAVVDEGILQLKDYKTPDPHAFFYQKRALEVNAYDLYPFLFPELGGSPKSSFGGDGYDLAKRINPLTSKRVKLVSVWSGQLKADGDGEVAVDVTIPEFSGAVRIMAVSYKDNAFGSSEKVMRISDPLVISAALPRFISPKDTLLVPVTLSNTTTRRTTANSSLTLTGPLRIVGSASLSAEVNANGEAQVLYKLVASEAIGQASVTVNVRALGEQFSNLTELAVRPVAPLQQITGAGSLKAAEIAQINPKHDFLPASVSSKLVVSNSPMAEFTDDITYLLQYPHGCLEQTISTAFPLLYFADLAKSLRQEKNNRTYNPNYLIQEAIVKIEAMQQFEGGFSYWPNGTGPDSWTSIYAAHFLLEARKAGYLVNKEILDKALAYLQRQVKGKAMEEYRYYNASQELNTKYVASRDITYALYVLSLAGKPDWATMNYYKAKPELLSLDSRYLLASTFAITGRRENFIQTLPPSFSGETSIRTLGGNFNSPLRDMAIALNALLEADPDHQQVGTLARHLSQELRSKKWFNTQERAFALLALGKLARRSNGPTAAQISQKGKVLSSYSGKDLSLHDKLQNGEISIKSGGQGTLYYFWETEGISRSGSYKEEDSYLQVRKTFFDRNGKPVSNNTFRLNDLVIVRIALHSLDGRSIPNVAITDLLPAGFEIENPRLMSEREFKWLQDQKPAVPEHIDIRDDRINIYATAKAKEQYFFYQVRAVSKGIFQLGPVGADAMYHTAYHSYAGGGVVKIR